jgi:hypothetical protein
MKSLKQLPLSAICIGAFAAAALSCAPVWAEGSGAASAPVAAAKTAARHDFTKLSHAGTQMMVDVTLARAALFDGHTQFAATRIKQAQLAMQKAEKDDTAFLKAESDLTPPPGHEKPAQPDTTVKAWLPVGGGVEVIDDYKTLTPEKAKAVEDANAKLKKGDEKGAVEQLKLADVTVISSVEVVPLDATVASVHEAAGLMDAEKYYEAGQVLRRIQDSVRISVLDVNTKPAPAKKPQ